MTIKQNILISLTILILLIGGIFIYKYTYLNNSNIMNQSDIKLNAEQTKHEVIDIAQNELFKHYPEGMRDGKKYELTQVVPITGSSNWKVVYSIANSLDTNVEITVDPVLKKIVSYQDQWS